MQNSCQDISTREIITFVIAVAGFSLSLSSWIYTLITQWRNLKISAREINTTDTLAFVYIMLENKSRLPIAINNISVLIDNKVISCASIAKVINEKTRIRGNTVVERDFERSFQFPIQLQALGAAGGFILFENIPAALPVSSKHLTLLVSTNRGRTMKMKLSLSVVPVVRYIP